MTNTQAQPTDNQHLSLQALFAIVAQSFPDLQLPNSTVLEPLAAELEQADRQKNTTIYILATLTAVLLLAGIGPFLFYAYGIAVRLQSATSSYLARGDCILRDPVIAGATALAAFASFFYVAVMPFTSPLHSARLRRLPFLSRSPAFDIEPRATRFIVLAVALVYMALGEALILAGTYTSPAGTFVKSLQIAWLLLPVPVLYLLLAFLLMLLLALLSGRRGQFERAPQAALLRRLLELLFRLRDISTPADIHWQQRRDLTRRLSAIAGMFRALYGPPTGLHVPRWAAIRMKRVADNVDVLASWLAFSKPDTVVHLKRRLVSVTNAVLAGTYDALPASPLDETAGFLPESRRATVWRRGASLLLLLGIVALPLLVFSLVSLHAHLSIPAPFQQLAIFLYSGWVVVCLLAHLEQLAPDARALVLDVIKTIFHH